MFVQMMTRSDYVTMLAPLLGFRDVVALAGSCVAIRRRWGFSVNTAEFRQNSDEERWATGALHISSKFASFFDNNVQGYTSNVPDRYNIGSLSGRDCIHLFHLTANRLHTKLDKLTVTHPETSRRAHFMYERHALLRSELKRRQTKRDNDEKRKVDPWFDVGRELNNHKKPLRGNENQVMMLADDAMDGQRDWLMQQCLTLCSLFGNTGLHKQWERKVMRLADAFSNASHFPLVWMCRCLLSYEERIRAATTGYSGSRIVRRFISMRKKQIVVASEPANKRIKI